MKLFRLFCLFLLLSGVVLATNPGKDLFIPAGARATGAFGTFWQTDLRIFNTENSSCSVTIYYLPRATFASHATSTVVNLSAHEIRVYENVLENLFGITDNTAGGFRLTSSCNIMAESRTWTPGAVGTYGQRIPGIPKDHEIRAGETSNVLYIDNVPDFRTNFGMIETSGNGSTVALHLYDGTGNHVGQQDVTLGAYEMKQIDGILATFGASGSNYRVALQVNSGSVIPYASQVDNNSGDPIYIDGSVARCQGGNGGGEVVCGDGKYYGYLVQTNNGDWEGFINAPLNVTIDNWNIIGWDEDDMGVVYITPANYVILLGYGGTFDTPIPISDGQPFNISYTLEYQDSNGKKVLTADFVNDGVLNCNYLTGSLTGTIKALDPQYKDYAGKYYWNYEGGIQ
ncbi:MAG: hypothetical protein WHV67_04980 [Thermoanaerobaculia bacterium]